jgi:hypothetical protein
MTARHDLEIRQGQDWSFVYTHLDSGGSAVDLTGYSARASFKVSYEGSTEAYLSSGDDADGGSIALGGANGTVTMSMTAAQTTALLEEPSLFAWAGKSGKVNPVEKFIYDLELVDGSGVVTRVLEGRVFIQREVTVAT